MLRSFRTYIRSLFYELEPELRSKTIKFKLFEAKVFNLLIENQMAIPEKFVDNQSVLKVEALLSPHVVK